MSDSAGQRLLDIGLQILHVLDPDRESQLSVSHTHLPALLPIQVPVGGGGGGTVVLATPPRAVEVWIVC